MRGLETLLLDDSKQYPHVLSHVVIRIDTGPPDAGQPNDLQHILESAGIDYSHRNERLIQNNVIEERKVNFLIKVRRWLLSSAYCS